MDEDLVVLRSFVIPASELSERFSRSSGPGGQGVNTADSRVELSYDVGASPAVPEHLRPLLLRRLENRLVNGVLTVAASEHRAQLQNRVAARKRLVMLLSSAVKVTAPRRPTKPTRGSQERRIAEKKRRAQTKQGRKGGTWD
ncbi:alternative ribosome rescue aminoacyl-tRNA hydrolase ArfB [Actinosynnema pretiosum]|uniref:alternative ribosome rescue aminoacyl-tRNA hydrolase ArfB n=1 Tax=Actinosynnema pretiosum TaxID=42197 RepID=UPI000B0E18D0|nr:alternative ribosome rescue aminoacyl-tRNA hydrolase ArfB [Actinosynnema pretiosum]